MSHVTEASVRDALKQVRYPEVTKDVVSCGIVKKVDVAVADVTVLLGLPTMVVAPPVRDGFEKDVRDTVAASGPWARCPPRAGDLGVLPRPPERRLAQVKRIAGSARGVAPRPTTWRPTGAALAPTRSRVTNCAPLAAHAPRTKGSR